MGFDFYLIFVVFVRLLMIIEVICMLKNIILSLMKVYKNVFLIFVFFFLFWIVVKIKLWIMISISVIVIVVICIGVFIVFMIFVVFWVNVEVVFVLIIFCRLFFDVFVNVIVERVRYKNELSNIMKIFFLFMKFIIFVFDLFFKCVVNDFKYIGCK